jgi:hypothetical protein
MSAIRKQAEIVPLQNLDEETFKYMVAEDLPEPKED